MNAALYPARIWREDGVYYVQFLDLENGFTFGNTLLEAQDMAADALSALLASCIEHGAPILRTFQPKGKGHLLDSARCQGAGRAIVTDGARFTSTRRGCRSDGNHLASLPEIEQPDANTTLSKLQKAAKVLGKRLVIELR